MKTIILVMFVLLLSECEFTITIEETEPEPMEMSVEILSWNMVKNETWIKEVEGVEEIISADVSIFSDSGIRYEMESGFIFFEGNVITLHSSPDFQNDEFDGIVPMRGIIKILYN